MAGLGVLLEKRTEMEASYAKIIKKSFVARSLSPRSGSALPSRSNGGFLESCFLCGKRLSLENDVYMYRGDRGFCSVECRCRQIFLDEEEKVKRKNCSLAASPSHGRERILEHRESVAGGFVC